MIEMRWLMTQGSYERVLQFRQQVESTESEYLEWGEWEEVSTIING